MQLLPSKKVLYGKKPFAFSCLLLLSAVFAGEAFATTTISSTDRHAYAANAG